MTVLAPQKTRKLINKHNQESSGGRGGRLNAADCSGDIGKECDFQEVDDFIKISFINKSSGRDFVQLL